MSVMDPTLTPAVIPPGPPPVRESLQALTIQMSHTTIDIPSRVVDLRSFREWAHSPEFPQFGSFSFLNGVLWADLSMEEMITHNRVKTRFTTALCNLVDQGKLGFLYSDGVLLTNPTANLSTEPDATFCLWETLQSSRVRMVPGKKEGYIELEGTPDFVLEIISATSVKKDTATLPPLYARAGIPEFWLVNARKTPAELLIFRLDAEGYKPQPATEKGVFSPLFTRHFQMIEETDPMGNPSFFLRAQA